MSEGDYEVLAGGETDDAITRVSNDEAERGKRDRNSPSTSRSKKKKSSKTRKKTDSYNGEADRWSSIMTIFHGVNVLAGAGLLSTPFAIKEAGWFTLVLLPFFAVLRCYTSILVQYHFKSENGIKSKNGSENGIKSKNGSENGIRSYADVGENVYGTYGRHLLLIVWQLELYSHCVEVIISEGDNLTRLFPGVSFEWAGIHLDSFRFGILTALIILVIVQFRGVTSYLSAFRVVVTVMMVVSLIFLGTLDGVGFHPSGSLVNWHKIPFAFQFYSSCYSGHSVFPSISRHLSESTFKKALLFSYALATAIYVIFGSLGYLMFGEDTQSQITLNLPKHSIASIFANITMVIKPLSRYALLINALAEPRVNNALAESLEEESSEEESLEEPVVNNASAKTLVEEGDNNALAEEESSGEPGVTSSFLPRTTLLVISTVLVAFLLPSFGQVKALIGSLPSILVAVCFLKKEGKQAAAWKVLHSILIIVLGVLSALLGIHSSRHRSPTAIELLDLARGSEYDQ